MDSYVRDGFVGQSQSRTSNYCIGTRYVNLVADRTTATKKKMV